MRVLKSSSWVSGTPLVFTALNWSGFLNSQQVVSISLETFILCYPRIPEDPILNFILIGIFIIAWMKIEVTLMISLNLIGELMFGVRI